MKILNSPGIDKLENLEMQPRQISLFENEAAADVHLLSEIEERLHESKVTVD